MEPITSILFDLGGVLYYIDPELTRQAFKRLGVIESDGMAKAHQPEIYNLYETGRIETAEFLSTLQKGSKEGVSASAIEEGWIALLLGIPDSNVQLVLDLKNEMPVYLLSNINDIHVERCNKELKASRFETSLQTLFTRAFLSCEMGMRKPDADIFEKVLEEENLNPKNILFLDDTAANIETAKNLGFQTALITPEYPVQMALNEKGLWP